jgi:RHS repeat-associated protein
MSDPAGIYLRARTFDPVTGQFLSVDPVRPGAPGVVGYNPYSYVANNPTTWTDPSGMFAATAVLYRVGPAVAAGTAVAGLGLGIRLTLMMLAGIIAAPLACAIACGIGTAPPGTIGNPPLTLPPATLGRIADGLQRLLPALTRALVETIAATCAASALASAAGGDIESLCTGRRFPIFLTGGDAIEEASLHDLAAFTVNARWAILTHGQANYLGTPVPEGWYTQVQYDSPCLRSTKGDCHEFPYYSTNEGGPDHPGHPGAVVKTINRTANRSQGSLLRSRVYVRCGVAVGQQFGVLPIPLLGVPTTGLC